MIKVHSISGGKSSAYMALHYPADYYLFALVQIEDKRCRPKDPGIIRKVEDRIGREFVGTSEDPKTIQVVLDLEQRLGEKIIWLTGPTFDEVIRGRSALPNKMWRFCTTEMKMMPIFKWWYKNIGEPVKMGIGFRLDEFERCEKFSTEIKYRYAQKLTGQQHYRWNEVVWREGWFPMVDDQITRKEVNDYWKGKDIDFPDSSNCKMCFWKHPQELRQNWDSTPEIMEWGAQWEQESGNTFRTDMSLSQIQKIGKQQSMFWGGGSCQSEGYCTD